MALVALVILLASCSTNPATGERQFTALMSPAQEQKVGAQEHKKITKQFGFYEDQAVTDYVRQVGASVAKNTERPDVRYQFFVLDSPIVNAFALPGGYVYVSRGLLALAGSEAELAAVLAHETGHITARHSAERYSHGVVTSLGAALLSAAVGDSGISQAAGIGSDLYIKSYSRSQENEADTLGIRYLSRAGYDESAMTGFLGNLGASNTLESQIDGRGSGSGVSYFSTHPATSERVAKTVAEAGKYPPGGGIAREVYLQKIDRLVYGDSAHQGFIRGEDFYHTELDFTFSVPVEFKLINQPGQVVATSKSGAVIVFDLKSNPSGANPLTYLTKEWMAGEALTSVETITVNGYPAASGSFPGRVQNQDVTIQVLAIQWQPNRFARFQIAVPNKSTTSQINGLKRATYSFRRLTAEEKKTIRPQKISIITAQQKDSVASLARHQPFPTLQEQRFRVLNGLRPGENIVAGQRYKIVVE